MVKLFGREIRLRERFKGFFDVVGGGQRKTRFNAGELSWNGRCRHYDSIYLKHGLAKGQILTLAGQISAKGIFLEAPKESSRADEVVTLCEDFNKQVNMRSLIHDTVIDLAKYGSSFWEKTFTPTFNVREMPQMESLEPATQDRIGNVTSWRLRIGASQTYPTFQVPDEVVEFHWNRSTQTWPYGTSLLTGLDTEFEILAQMEQDMKDHFHKVAFPKEIVGVGDATYHPTEAQQSSIANTFKRWRPGQTIVSSFPIQYEAGGTGNRRVENLSDVLNFVKDQATDGLMVPPISKQYQSSLASSKEMSDWAQANLIQPMQWIISWVIARHVYQPLAMANGYSVKLTPEILWEEPESDREENAEYYSKLVGAGIMPPKVAARELGFEEEFEEWEAEEEVKQQEQMAQQRALGIQQQQQSQGDGDDDEFFEVRRRSRQSG